MCDFFCIKGKKIAIFDVIMTSNLQMMSFSEFENTAIVFLATFSGGYGIKFVPKLKILYFLPPFCPKFGPFCTFLSLHILFMAYKVQFWYCFIGTTIFSFHLWIYSIPIGKLALKFTILYLWPPVCPKFGHFCNFKSVYNLFNIVLFVEPFFLSIYGFTVFQMAHWPQKLRFCILDLYFAQNVSVFATFRAYTTYLCLAKYSFGIVSFA